MHFKTRRKEKIIDVGQRRQSSTYVPLVPVIDAAGPVLNDRGVQKRRPGERLDRPMPRGLALIAARNALGGDAAVAVRGRDLCFLRADGSVFASATTWEGCVAACRARIKKEREQQAV